ncbi:MAG: phosphatase PAP2 family protein [Chitinophagaceae bacterium]
MGKNLPQKQNPTRVRETYLLSAALLAPLVMIWLVFISNQTAADRDITAFIAGYVTESRTAFLKSVSFLGNHKFLVPANLFLIAGLLYLKRGNTAWRWALAALSSLGLMSLIKNLFQRPRPENPMVEGITNFSFPSGHALMGAVFYGLLIWLIRQNVRDHRVRNLLITLLVFLLLLIGFSRIYLRVHYTSDVIAGYGIGVCWLYAVIRVTRGRKSLESGLVQKPEDRPF